MLARSRSCLNFSFYVGAIFLTPVHVLITLLVHKAKGTQWPLEILLRLQRLWPRLMLEKWN